MNETAFLSSPSALGQSESLASKYIVAPLWKSLSQLNPFGSSSHETDDESRIWKRYQHTRLVHLGLVEEAATAFISKMITDPPTEHSASLFTPAIFQSRYSLSLLASHMDIAKPNTEQLYLGLSERDCKILLRYLARDKEVLVADEDGKCYKMVPQFGDAFETQVNEADRGTIAIIQTIDKLERQIEAIHQEMKGWVGYSNYVITSRVASDTLVRLPLGLRKRPRRISNLGKSHWPFRTCDRRNSSTVYWKNVWGHVNSSRQCCGASIKLMEMSR